MTKREVVQLGYDVIGSAITVHKSLGPGLLESVYEKCLKIELEKNRFFVKQQVNVPISYEGVDIDVELRIDLLVNDMIVLELKSIENILPIHKAQLLTYMKLLKVPKGILINFFTENITKSSDHFVNEYFRELED